MSYKYYKSFISNNTSPSQGYKDDLQALINEQFDNSSDIYTIQEELDFGSKVFTDVDVRITHVSYSDTGEKLGDDFKAIIFKNMDHAKGMGYRYFFDNNYWITVNSDNYKYVTASSVIRRCNNVLRWKDKFGAIQEEPCVIEYRVTRTQFEFNESIMTTQGDMQITCQYNEVSKNIEENKRFMFNNKVYKISFVNNFLNQHTMDNDTPPLIHFMAIKDSENDSTDNFDLGIADYYTVNYVISINQDSLSQNVGTQGILDYSLTLNGQPSNEQIEWISSNNEIATIDNTGHYNLLQVGNVTFTVRMINNHDISDSINVSIISVPTGVKDIVINPIVTSILEGDTQVYNAYLTVDGVQQNDVIDVTASGIPSNYYKLNKLTNNSFNIQNLANYPNNPLHIVCSASGISKSFDIKLLGMW